MFGNHQERAAEPFHADGAMLLQSVSPAITCLLEQPDRYGMLENGMFTRTDETRVFLADVATGHADQQDTVGILTRVGDDDPEVPVG
jgi:hypothetical protein